MWCARLTLTTCRSKLAADMLSGEKWYDLNNFGQTTIMNSKLEVEPFKTNLIVSKSKILLQNNYNAES